MPRVGLSPDAVVDAAIGLLDSGGPDAVTLAAVAAATGVAAPSLYKHIESLDSLRRLIAVRSMNELADRLATAVLGRSQDDALYALMTAYRAYALAYPNRYAALPQQPVSDPALAAAGTRGVEVILAVLRGYGLADHDAIHAARAVRAAAHGFASLQTAGAFQLAEDLDTSYDRLIGTLAAGFRQPGPPESLRNSASL
jgi:AcrR family transcriptional regulator